MIRSLTAFLIVGVKNGVPISRTASNRIDAE
jgi:hypothetical protein